MKKNLKKATILSLAIVFFFTISVSATDGIRKDLDNLKNTFSLINYSVTGGNITGIPVGFNFTSNLGQGVKRIDVLYLQKILNSDIQTRVSTTGPGSPGSETDYFGPATTGAVKRFQEKYASEILTPFGLTTPTGFVGQSTIVKLNQLLKTKDTDEDSEIVKMLREIQRAIDELSQRVDRLEEDDDLEQENKIWIEISPIQCMLNPWQIDYIERGNYPREWEEEKKIIKGYYERLGVSVFDIFSEVVADGVCLACHCSDGTKLYLLIDSSDLKRMSDDGFNRTEKDMMTCTEKCESLGYTEGSCLSFGIHPTGFEEKAEIMKTFDKLGETRDCFLPQNRYRPDGIDKNCYCFPKK